MVGVVKIPIVEFFGTFDPTFPALYTLTLKLLGLRTIYILPPHVTPLDPLSAVVKVGTIKLTIDVLSPLVPVIPKTVNLL